MDKHIRRLDGDLARFEAEIHFKETAGRRASMSGVCVVCVCVCVCVVLCVCVCACVCVVCVCCVVCVYMCVHVCVCGAVFIFPVDKI